LKEKKKSINCILADPPGAVLFNKFSSSGSGELERKGDGSITEGIGQGRITGISLFVMYNFFQ
jgi:cysteine synthase A